MSEPEPLVDKALKVGGVAAGVVFVIWLGWVTLNTPSGPKTLTEVGTSMPASPDHGSLGAAPALSASVAVIATPSLPVKVSVAVHLETAIDWLSRLGPQDVQVIYLFLEDERFWLSEQPETVALSEYRFVVTQRYDELRSAGGTASLVRLQEIVRDVIKAAEDVPE